MKCNEKMNNVETYLFSRYSISMLSAQVFPIIIEELLAADCEDSAQYLKFFVIMFFQSFRHSREPTTEQRE